MSVLLDSPVQDSLATAPRRTGPFVVMDEQSRCSGLYGPVFARLGIEPCYAHDRSPEQVMALQPSAILLTSEWADNIRLTAAAARRAGLPVIYVVDGALEWSYLWNNVTWIRPNGTNLQPLTGSDLCVFGQHQARIFSSLGLASRIHVIGLPRLDGVSRERIVTPGARPRIVVATSRTAGHDVEQQVMVLRALRDLQAWFATRSDIDVVWRIAADLAEDIGVRPDVGGSMNDVLARATALISLPSTCLLEGMYKGIPVAQIEYRSVPLYNATAWEIRCAAHIPGVVHELLYPPPAKLAWQDACFADELETGDATGRLAEVIREVLVRTNHYSPSDQPVRIHGKLDYRQIYSELSAFAMDDTAILQYELSAAYSTLRQARVDKASIRHQCIEMTEAFAGADIGLTRMFALLDQLSTCKARQKPPGKISEASAMIEGSNARALLLHPPIDAVFTVPTGAAGRLSFAISLPPESWNDPASGPCRFVISANEKVVFDVTLDQRTDPEDRRWHWFEVPVSAASTGAQNLVFSTRGVGGDTARPALWRNPAFVWLEREVGTNETFAPRAAVGGSYYVPGRSVV